LNKPLHSEPSRRQNAHDHGVSEIGPKCERSVAHLCKVHPDAGVHEPVTEREILKQVDEEVYGRIQRHCEHAYTNQECSILPTFLASQREQHRTSSYLAKTPDSTYDSDRSPHRDSTEYCTNSEDLRQSDRKLSAPVKWHGRSLRVNVVI
jgi:hypothetical protein